MSDWFETLDGTLAKVWSRLSEAAHASAHLSFATVSPDAWPEVRTVVLRHADTETQTLEIYTDSESDKIASLIETPRASLMLWDADLALQIRAQGEVTILTGDVVMDRWHAVPDHSKLSYGVTPAPGHIITASDAYTKAPNPDVFAVLSCTIMNIDAVHLGKPHRRASFSRLGEWQGNWLAP